MAHGSELRAGADVQQRCERHGSEPAAAAGRSRPLLGAALLVTRALLIANPAAARTEARAVTTVRDALRRGGWAMEVLATARAGDARRFARGAEARGCDALVCYGGDGTAMEIAAGAVGDRKST